ncbi:MAG: signal peptidase I [Anaerolineae bacterium]|nr:signal peptidase I [Anaerolineae bacterium]
MSRTGRFFLRVLTEIAGTVLPAILVALVINLFLAQATVVQGQSMEPTLYNNQRVIVEKITYRFIHGPRRGDVVVLQPPGQDELLIKRVIGLPGELVEVRGGQVFVDGQPIDEPWAVRQGGPNYPPTLIPPLHIFVLGDNRGHSNDSRSFGPIMVDQIVGRAWVIYWPLEKIGSIE